MIPDHLWRLPASALVLPTTDVHVWRASLEQPATCAHRLLHLLSHDEQARANRFYLERDRRRFIVARGALRTILGCYLDVEPGQLRFRYESHGKPFLSDEFSASALRFNLAHSNELALYAFTCGREIGIDVECIRPVPDIEQIAVRFFSANENMALRMLPESQRLEAFFNCWTRKEAYIKTLGEGLTQPLDQFQVSLIPGEPAQLLSVNDVPEKATRWSIAALSPAPGYIGALAVEDTDCCLECWHCLL